MTNTCGVRAWRFLKSNPAYIAAWEKSAAPAPAERAPFPLRTQTESDRDAATWGLLAWEDPHTEGGPASPFWVDTCLISRR